MKEMSYTGKEFMEGIKKILDFLKKNIVLVVIKLEWRWKIGAL